MSVQIVLDGTLSSESVVAFVHCLLLLKMDPVCTYGNDLCQTKEDELGAKYQPDPLSSQLQSWPELVFTFPLLSPYLHLLRLCTTLSTVRGSKVPIGLENCHLSARVSKFENLHSFVFFLHCRC